MCRCAAAHEQRPAPLNKNDMGAMPFETRFETKKARWHKVWFVKKKQDKRLVCMKIRV